MLRKRGIVSFFTARYELIFQYRFHIILKMNEQGTENKSCSSSHVYLLNVVVIVQIHSGSSEAEEENDPDGCYAFRRKAGCQYYAVSALL